MSNRSERGIILALDTASRDEALTWVCDFLPYTPYFKVGLELFSAAGPDLVHAICAAGGKVFLDLKLYDIPNTVEKACAVIAKLGVSMTTVHAAGGKEMLAAARRGVEAVAPAARPLLLVVTVLTSVGEHATLARDVLARARLAQDCGCDGVICSPHEAAGVRAACGADFVIVTPGIRLLGEKNDDYVGAHVAPSWPGQARPGASPSRAPWALASDDQMRVADPTAAFKAGAHFIVMGRAITQAKDPEAAILAAKRGMIEG